jgi:hypothetical protein
MSKLIRKGIEFYLPTTDLLKYEPDTGLLRWSEHQGNFSRVGAIAGGKTNRGYIHVKVNGTKLLAHRIAWYMTYKVVPDHIDHINGNKVDNRLCNLRSCTASENAMNRTKLATNNTSGHTGVVWNKKLGKWTAAIRFKGESRHLGVFLSYAEAVTAREEAEAELTPRMHLHKS